MKLVAAIILVGGCAAAALWVPYEGRTLYQRAEEKGVPAATAHAVGTAAKTVGTAASSALRWATASKPPAPAQPAEKKPAARKAEKKPAAAPARPEQRDVQPAPAVAHAPVAAPVVAPVVPRPVASEKARTLALAPVPLPAQAPAATGQDKIVRTAAPERISSGDRAALDQLVAKARR
jgi:hypothetical protein